MSDDGSWGDDPGWAPALRDLLFTLVPGGAFLRAKRRVSRGTNPLLMLRSLLMTFAGAIVLIGWVVVVLYLFGRLSAAVDGGPAAGVMAALAVTSVVVGEAVGNARRLDCSNPFNLLESYRRRFFLRLAIAEAAALFGFVGFILTNNPVMYLIGALATGVGFYRLAPTHTHLVAESDRMQFDGCQYRLERVLMQRPGTAR